MSKKSKKASKAKNLQRKRARRAANQARYQAMALVGQNTKSKRARHINKQTRKVSMIDHPEGRCGNIACTKCFPNIDRTLTVKYIKPRMFKPYIYNKTG